jgi:hypothetical protein
MPPAAGWPRSPEKPNRRRSGKAGFDRTGGLCYRRAPEDATDAEPDLTTTKPPTHARVDDSRPARARLDLIDRGPRAGFIFSPVSRALR